MLSKLRTYLATRLSALQHMAKLHPRVLSVGVSPEPLYSHQTRQSVRR